MENNTKPTVDEIMSEVAQISAAGTDVPPVESIQTPTVDDIPSVSQVEVSSTIPAEEPVAAEPVQTIPAEEPVAAEPVQTIPAEEPVATEPVQTIPAEEPVAAEPVQTIPVEEPVAAEPVQTIPAEEPVVTQTAQTEPVAAQPVQTAQTTSPVYTQPAAPMNYQYQSTGILQDESDKMLKKSARNSGLGAIGVLALFWVLALVLDMSSIWLLIIPFVLSFNSLKKSRAKSVVGWIGMIASILTALILILGIVVLLSAA